MQKPRTFDNVITYRRWSTLEQGNSDRSSDDRQIAVTERFCREQGWTITQSHVDAGRSAFTGENLTKGKLGTITTKLLTGALEPRETVIVVEELDRLSRQSPGRMTSWMQPLLMAGVTFAIAGTGQFITEKTMDDFGSFVSTMSAAFSAYEFSRRQRDKGNGSWAKRRKAAGEGQNLSRHRARGWLRWDDAKRDYIVIPDRAWLVGEMFRLRIHGINGVQQGKGATAKLFNKKARTDPRYRAFSSSLVQPKEWTTTAIGRIIHDPAVCGMLQYYTNPRGGNKRVPVGDPVKVYPEVISATDFALANETRLNDQLKIGGTQRAVSNLIGPLGRCKACGGVMQPLGSSRWRTNKDGSRSQHYFLYCLTAKMTKGQGCSNQRGWTYSRVEQPLLEHVLALALDDQHFRMSDSEAAQLEGNVVRLKRKLSDLQASAKRMFVAMGEQEAEDYEIAAYEAVKRNIKTAREELDSAQIELSAAKGRVTPAEHVVRVADIRARLQSEDADERYGARFLVKAALKQAIKDIVFDPATGKAVATLAGDLGRLFIRDNGEAWFYSFKHPRRGFPDGVTPEESETIREIARRMDEAA
jgi:DNA invertase Pin-like site-specific DNA recombinase